MNLTYISWIVVGSSLLLFLLLRIRTFFVFVSGVWFEQKQGEAPTAIVLSQVGPYVWGRSEVKGGVLRYSGWFDGRKLKLRRKDEGQAYLVGLGFPKEVVGVLQGSEMARYVFRYDMQKELLVGEHFRQKIDISRTRPPKVTQRAYLPAIEKVWTRQRKGL
ncbi:MAG: hypothetical protein AAGJ35_08420 [Myxococcota bacterium]